MGPEPLMNKRGPGAMLNALTFDVEEYFHAEVFSNVVRQEDWTLLPSRAGESTRRLLDLLDAHGVAATFFVLGWVADRDPGLVREIRDRGHEVACHGFPHRLIYAMKPAVFQADVRRAKRTVEDAIGAPILGCRAPTFSRAEVTPSALA